METSSATIMTRKTNKPRPLGGPRPHDFVEMMEQRRQGVPGYVTYGDFLDAFYRAAQEERQQMIDKEPPDYGESVITFTARANLAATAEKLAHDYELTVPAWTEKPEYFLSELYMCGRKASTLIPELVTELKKESPQEFLRRGLLVSANALSRM
ncbi:MAG: hypothetical protein LBG97_06215 [Coriobacteriales bacterium]|jgi:hypothetical protein|nr:hypothetical protein [Coriobacteriales bacterium]